mmetsp:Transcript_51987/g.166479  ORF Transcript_51987/g.166479 Transcript_51987/m.166479 type:complete len:110 (+) Transcript_51987:556-885(+)
MIPSGAAASSLIKALKPAVAPRVYRPQPCLHPPQLASAVIQPAQDSITHCRCSAVHERVQCTLQWSGQNTQVVQRCPTQIRQENIDEPANCARCPAKHEDKRKDEHAVQ